MRASKLLKIFETFDHSLWQKANSFLENHCTPNEYALFKEYFIKRKNLNHKDLNRDSLIKRISQGNRNAFKTTNHRLFKKVEDFIVQYRLKLKDYSWERKMALMSYYKETGLLAHFKSGMKSIIKELEGLPEYSIEKDFKKFQAKHELVYSSISIEERTPFFNSAMNDLRNLFENSKHLYEIEFQNGKELLDVGYEINGKASKTSFKQLLDLLSDLNSTKSEMSFRAIHHLLINDIDNFSIEIAHICNIYLINYCFYRIKNGDMEYIAILSSLFDFGLESKILLSSGKISESTYLSIIEIKTMSSDKVGIDQIIKSWIPKTNTVYPETLINLSKAYYSFNKQDYQNAITILNAADIRQIEVHLGLRVRWLQVCGIYALYGNDKISESTLETAKKYFNRKEQNISKLQFQSSLNLIKTIEMLSKSIDPDTIVNFVDNNPMVMRIWVLNQIKKARHNSALQKS